MRPDGFRCATCDEIMDLNGAMSHACARGPMPENKSREELAVDAAELTKRMDDMRRKIRELQDSEMALTTKLAAQEEKLRVMREALEKTTKRMESCIDPQHSHYLQLHAIRNQIAENRGALAAASESEKE